jgi:alpha-L-rhamnosidase
MNNTLNKIKGMILLMGVSLTLAARAAIGHPWYFSGLRCEGVETPLAVEEAHPQLTWTYNDNAQLPNGFVQVSARVVVATSSIAAQAGKGDVWDSGWVKTGEFAIRYGGPALQPGTDYWWSVTTQNGNDAGLAGLNASSPARFRTAEESWTARWIQAPWSTGRDGAELDGSKPMPVFRREFAVRGKVEKATLRIAGLGQYEVFLNGGSLMWTGLREAWTDYRKTVMYSTYDLTFIKAGKNALGVMLGNGMYNVQRTKGRYTKFEGSYGPPKLIAELRLTYADGSSEVIGTDAGWKVARGAVLFSSTYGGEDYDARQRQPGWNAAGFNDEAWAAAMPVDGPGGRLTAAIAPDVGEMKHFDAPKEIVLAPNKIVYDFGQNFAGWPHVKVKGPSGAVLRLTPGELLKPDGSVSQGSSGGPMWWTYTLRGDSAGEEWQPKFSYYGFRYVQAEWSGAAMLEAKGGLAAAKIPIATILDISGKELSSASRVTGNFESSDETLNSIHKLIVNAMHNNEASLFTDCPHREKLGWLEETHLVAPGLMFNNDLHGLYAATEKNIGDAQHADGGVPTTAPQYMVFGTVAKYLVFDDSPEWGSASVLAPWAAYRFYGDTSELERSYPVMKAYVKFLEGKAEEGIVAYGLGDWYDIGPGGPGISKNTSLGVTGTLMLYEDAVAMGRIAALLGHADDALMYAALVEREKDAFNRKFWDADKGYYDKGSQTANAMPLALSIVPEERRAAVLEHVVADIEAHDDHITTGEVGYPYMLRALMAGWRNDLVLAMMLRKDPPSYGSQLAKGATSLTEAWDANPVASQDHFMLGGAEEWFYRGLGGIDFDMSRSADERITIRPAMVEGLAWVKCSYKSVMGEIRSEWRQEDGVTSIDIAIPPGATGTLILPVKMVADISDLSSAKGNRPRLQETRRDDEVVVYRASAGIYHFREAESGP